LALAGLIERLRLRGRGTRLPRSGLRFGRVEQHVERVGRSSHVVREVGATAVCEDLAELLGDHMSRDTGEDGTDGTVEIEQ
jgi:hypothetical protein